MRHGGGQLTERGHLLHQQNLALNASELGRLLDDLLFQLLRPLIGFRASLVQITGHAVEGGGQLPQLVARSDVDARVQIALGDPLRTLDQLDDRPANDAIHKSDRSPADHHHDRQGQPEGSAAGIAKREIQRFERHLYVHDA